LKLAQNAGPWGLGADMGWQSQLFCFSCGNITKWPGFLHLNVERSSEDSARKGVFLGPCFLCTKKNTTSVFDGFCTAKNTTVICWWRHQMFFFVSQFLLRIQLYIYICKSSTGIGMIPCAVCWTAHIH
jgi:hypothetical protein